MKTTIFSLLMACGVTAFGQFIPQPNAYNPDANGDSFIGVDDVIGTLALYGNAFETGDSLVTMRAEFYLCYYVLSIGTTSDTIYTESQDPSSCWQGPFSNPIPIPESVDILITDINIDAETGNAFESIIFALPEGTGWKTLQVFNHREYLPGVGGGYSTLQFRHLTDDGYNEVFYSYVNYLTPTSLILTRLPNNIWHGRGQE